MVTQKKPIEELINVHKVSGDKEAIIFLKEAEHEYVERLFYTAKRYGRAEFMFRDIKHEVVRNKDFSFTVQPAVQQDLTVEEFA